MTPVTNIPDLAFENVSFSYEQNGKQICLFNSLSLHVNHGEFLSILGPSGVGKSTFFRLAAGLEQPDSGDILIRGKPVQPGETGYMPQEDLLMSWRTVLENGLLPLEIQGVNRRQAKEEIRTLLTQFGLGGTEDRYPHELSGGMRQRVSFLRAIAGGKRLLLLDEPFSALDSITRFHMQAWLLKQWQSLERTIVFITHDIEEALFLSDRIVLMTGRSGTDAIRHIDVPIPRPRTDAHRRDEAFLNLKTALLNDLRNGGDA
ncbi:ABC transporter ATP-binding protein [Salisediminibacterium selenitireducens]|uniref:ABC transporter related protein n=1 Tax=Bacillus selenitireducens (strain ATCC 700615 / DSM 15326 / MLS10) TaxID=439292 RepID=D6XXQ5_BACIE|nr:ABC transporter ATP-binding protein [Salisediminibacterium selenitireducens]ADI00098.1 ABC transporter related protein [[Bacillus] selenitireducens MLS10]